MIIACAFFITQTSFVSAAFKTALPIDFIKRRGKLERRTLKQLWKAAIKQSHIPS